MATHGRSGVGRMLYGSVADQVLRQAEVPVLLVPAHIDHDWPTDEPLNILVPLDGSPLAEAALASALPLTEAFAAKIHLLRVAEPPTYPMYGDGYAYIPYDEDADLAEARAYIEDQAAALRGRGLEVSATVLVGTAGRTIEAFARDQDVDLIAMATHGLGGLGRLVLGSVATDVLRRGIAPMLLVRSAGAADQAEQAAPPVSADQPTTAMAGAGLLPTLEIKGADLPLILRGLRALGHQPGTAQADVAAAQDLADALERQAGSAGSPTATRR
jgi:nucleotide-binding universal stress UspA family protein